MIERLARELGLAIADSGEYMRLQKAQSELERDEAIAAALAELNQKRERLVELFTEEPCDNVEAVELTDDIERLEGQLKESPLMAEVLAAQSEFAMLIRAVNDEINACIGITDTASASGSCGGNCDGCSGCRH